MKFAQIWNNLEVYLYLNNVILTSVIQMAHKHSSVTQIYPNKE